MNKTAYLCQGMRVEELRHIKKNLEKKLAETTPVVLSMRPDDLAMAATMVDSFWTDPSLKLSITKALVVWSILLIEEAETDIKDRNHFQERATWLQGSLNELKTELRLLTDEKDKLKVDLQNAESDVVEFSKRYDHATRAQEVITKALEESNDQKKELVGKVAELENALDSLKAECSGWKDTNLKMEKGTEDRMKAILKEIYPTLDLSAIEADYPASEDAGEKQLNLHLTEHKIGHVVFSFGEFVLFLFE
ncbi:Intermediate filament [Forsythia ovata]|uniref:Intermediate filament n=1 Tax=Forsythia ovata TaxID=205694 RepID=A0ABD1SKW4_9LAMI